MKEVIHIYGASGSGTTTLGKALCNELGYTFLDTDDFLWLDTDPKYTSLRQVDERLKLINEALGKNDKVVLSGSLSGWGDSLIPKFTLAIRVNTDTNIRIERLEKRQSEKFGDRILPNGDMYETHKHFIKWASLYDDGSTDMRSRLMHDEWEKMLTCKIIKVDGSKPINEIVEYVIKNME